MLQLLVGALMGSPRITILTVGTSGNNAGWSEGSYGSVDTVPNLPGGTQELVNGIFTATLGGADLTFLVLGSNPVVTDFTTLFIQDGTGTWRTLTSASASYAQSTNTTWTWGDGTNDVYALADDTEVHAFILV